MLGRHWLNFLDWYDIYQIQCDINGYVTWYMNLEECGDVMTYKRYTYIYIERLILDQNDIPRGESVVKEERTRPPIELLRPGEELGWSPVNFCNWGVELRLEGVGAIGLGFTNGLFRIKLSSSPELEISASFLDLLRRIMPFPCACDKRQPSPCTIVQNMSIDQPSVVAHLLDRDKYCAEENIYISL